MMNNKAYQQGDEPNPRQLREKKLFVKKLINYEWLIEPLAPLTWALERPVRITVEEQGNLICRASWPAISNRAFSTEISSLDQCFESGGYLMKGPTAWRLLLLETRYISTNLLSYKRTKYFSKKETFDVRLQIVQFDHFANEQQKKFQSGYSVRRVLVMGRWKGSGARGGQRSERSNSSPRTLMNARRDRQRLNESDAMGGSGNKPPEAGGVV
ncbi:hypothetical protein WN51_05978 [Melipona quadrifasciata]|uniref:Uncharacterized protein n=1 Tax=Melipona quadrifasciata TaxID=166423 RepID=A0A0M9A8L0_9HYME|nr:hypothetical protein WN51_05978 [Melipona quadrifasciata]